MKQIHPLTLAVLFFMSASMIIGAAEPDDSFDLATPIASGGAIAETLSGHNDVDFYRIEGIDQGHFQVTLTNLAGNFRLQLYNPDRKWLETSDNSELFDELIDRDVWGAGTYYLIVDSNGRAVNSGAYTLSVTYQPGFETNEPNDRWFYATHLSSGAPLSSYRSSPWDTDMYRIDIPAFSTLFIELTSLPANLNLNLYNANHSWLMGSDNNGVNEELMEYTNLRLEPTFVYALVGGSEYDMFNPYSIEVSTSPGTDTNEPNDSFPQAIPISNAAPIHSYISTSNDRDVYRFDLPAPGHLDIRLTNLPKNYWISLYNGNFSWVTNSDNNGTTDEAIIRDWTRIEPVYIIVGGNEFTDAAPYTLTVNFTPEPLTAQLAYPHHNQHTNGVIETNGSALGQDFASYQLEFGGGTAPDAWTTISSSNTPVTNGSLGAWDVTGLADGPCTLRLTTQNSVGDTAVQTITVYVNSTVGPDTYEPNYDWTAASPIALGDTIQSYIQSGGDDDYFTVEIPSATVNYGMLTAVLSNQPADYKLEVFGPTHNTIGGADDTGTEDEVVQAPIYEAGIYYIRVRNSRGSSGFNQPYDLTVTFDRGNSELSEPNNDWEHAAPITPGASIEGYLSGSGDYDIYQFDLTDLAHVTVSLTGQPEDYRLEVFNDNLDGIGGSNHPNAIDELVETDVFEDGTIYIRVRPAGSQFDMENPYTLNVDVEVYAVVTRITYPREDATVGGIVPIRGIAATNLPFSQYTLEYGAGESPSVWTPIGDPSIYQRVHETLATWDTTTLTQGIYTIRLTATDEIGRSDNTLRTVHVVSEPPEDVLEPNDSFNQAIPAPLSAPIDTYISSYNDTDVFSVNVPARGRLTVSLLNLPGNYRMNLYDPNRSWITTSDLPEMRDEVIEHITQEGGEYFVVVNANSGDFNAYTPYTFLAEFTPSTDNGEPNEAWEDAVALPLGTPIESYLHHVNDYDIFKIPVTEFGSLEVTLTNQPFNGRINLYNENLSWLTGSDRIERRNESAVINISRLGVYYAIVDSDDYSLDEPYVITASLSPNPISAAIDYPRHAESITGAVTILGTAKGSDFAAYELAYGPGSNPQEWTFISSSGDPVTEGPLGTWNVSGLADGQYLLRLLATSASLNPVEIFRSVNISAAAPNDNYESNDDWAAAQPIAIGETIQSYLKSGGDYDYFLISTPGRGTVDVTLTNPPGNYILEIYDFAHNGRGGSNNNGVNDEQVIFDTQEAADFYIRIRNSGGPTGTAEPYTLITEFTPGSDTDEPNNDWWHSIEIEPNSTTESYLSSSGDQDYWKILIPENGSLTASLTNLPSNYRLELFDGNLNGKGSSNNSGAADETVTAEIAKGTIFVRVRSSDGSYDMRAPYTLTLSYVSFALAANIDSPRNNSTVGGSVRIYGTALADAFASYNIDVRPANQPDTWTPIGGTHTEPVNRNQLAVWDTAGFAADAYVIRLTVLTGTGESAVDEVNVTLVTEPPDDPYEPNNGWEPTTPLPLNQPLQAYINPDNDQDIYRIVIPGPGVCDVRLTGLPADYRVNVYNANLDWWTGSDNLDLTEESVIINSGGAQIIYAIVAPSRGTPNPFASYTIEAAWSQGNDTHEPNNSWPTAPSVPANTPILSNLSYPGDEDIFAFDAPSFGGMRITLSSLPGNFRINLYNGNLNWLTGSDNSGNLTERINWDISEAGRYYVIVSSAGSEFSALKPYNLTIGFIEGHDTFEPNNTFEHATPHSIWCGSTIVSLLAARRGFLHLPDA